MIVIKMPGGAIEFVDGKELLWMRVAFPDERKDAIMLRLGGDRIYSIETLDDLKAKFAAAAVPLADFTPPEGKIDMVVNANNVRNVEPGNPVIYHAKARAILVFSRTVKLAVRETVTEAQAKLAPSSPTAARSSRVAAAARGQRRARQ